MKLPPQNHPVHGQRHLSKAAANAAGNSAQSASGFRVIFLGAYTFGGAPVRVQTRSVGEHKYYFTFGLMNGGEISIVFMGIINQRSHNWGAPPCMRCYVGLTWHVTGIDVISSSRLGLHGMFVGWKIDIELWFGFFFLGDQTNHRDRNHDFYIINNLIVGFV